MSRKPMNIALLALLIGGSLAGCTGGNNTSSSSNPAATSSSSKVVSSVITQQSVIKSLTANEEVVNLSEGDYLLLTQYYTIEGNSKLTATQKACEYESSDPSIVVIEGKTATALKPGEVTITVTSKEDSTKKCSFDIKVTGVFIDRDLTVIQDGDDFTNEWNEETGTGSFRTDKNADSNFYYVRGVKSKKWYVETDITVNEVNGDRFPKIGIFANGYNSSNAETLVSFFLNADIGVNDTWSEELQAEVMGEDNLNWTNFGVCEMAQGGQWAWDDGVGNSLARHNDTAYTAPTPITFGTTFKLGVARDDNNFHVWVNKTYAFTYQISTDLTILSENGSTLDSHVGFFHFKSDVTFANYVKTEVVEEVSKWCPKSFAPCTFYED